MPAAALRVLVGLAAAVVIVAAAQVTLNRRASEGRATAYVVLKPHKPVKVGGAINRTKVVKPGPPAQKGAPAVPPRPTSVPSVAPDDPLWRASWSLAKVGAPFAWRVTTGSPAVVVAVLDTGIDPNHPDLRGSLVAGWDAVNEDADATDDHGHGTAVAGIIAARSNNGIGIAGACWRCSLMPIKVIAANGTGTSADIADGLRWAADHGAALINLSFVMTGRDGGVADAIDYARAKGSLVVAAAGNSGASQSTFPASHPGVISVTATDGADRRYGWATYGRWVSVAAPGCSQSTLRGGAYGEFCGSSSAAAFMSGVTALVRSAVSNAGGDVVFSMLATNAVRVGDFVSSGRVDVAAPLRASSADCCALTARKNDLKP